MNDRRFIWKLNCKKGELVMKKQDDKTTTKKTTSSKKVAASKKAATSKTKKQNNEQDEKRIRRIILIIVIIIIILLLLTKCSIDLFGKIGDKYGSSSDYTIDNKDNDLPEIYDEELKFVKQSGETLVDDVYRVEFYSKNIYSNDYTCKTSDAEIATCIVRGDYVEVYPKKVGEVDVFVVTVANGKRYIGKHHLKIKDIDRGIVLDKTSGTIYLDEFDTMEFFYTLLNCKGDVTYKLSDDSAAIVTIKDGKVTVKALKLGEIKVVLSVKYFGREYTKTIAISVEKRGNNTGSNGGNSGNTGNPSNPGNPNEPSNPSNPSDKPGAGDGNGGTELDDNNKLLGILIDKGTLDPSFNSNVNKYNVDVPYNVSTISLDAIPVSNKAQITYIVNGKIVDNLNNVALNVGNNKVEIIVTSEAGSVNLYQVNIKRNEKIEVPEEKDSDCYLSNLYANKGSLTPQFNKDTNNYELIVSGNESDVSLVPTLSSSKALMKYFVDGKEVKSLKDIVLDTDKKVVRILVIAEDGSTKTYEVVVRKKERRVEFAFAEQEIEALKEEKIYYSIYEGEKQVNDYSIADISVSGFNGYVRVEKGYIVVKATAADYGKSYNLNIGYRNSSDVIKLNVKKKDYYLNVSDSYTINLSSDGVKKNIILNTNIFQNDVEMVRIQNGIRLFNKVGYVDLISNDLSIVNVDYLESDNQNVTSYLSVLLKAISESETTIRVVANVLGEEICNKEIKIKVVHKFKIVLDANDGFFDVFTTKYTFLLEKNDKIDLSDYDVYKVDQPDKCLYFELNSWNTLVSGNGKKYDKNSIISNFEEDLTLYAIYEKISSYKEIINPGTLYLTEVDLFHNEEYYKEHKVDKIIYPGAHGYHIMTINNNTGETIKLKNLNLKETTTCIGSLGCINMGYVVKYAKSEDKNYTYFYGSSTNYDILNKDKNVISSGDNISGYQNKVVIPFNDGIEIQSGEGVEISLLWQWVDIDDVLDTQIGQIKDDQVYSLEVSIDYEKVSNVCVKS